MSERLAIRILLGLGITVLVIWVGRELWGMLERFTPVLALFFSAWLISFVLSPPTNALVRAGARRPLAVLSVYALVALGLTIAAAILTPMIADQLGRLLEMVNSYTAQTPVILTWLSEQVRSSGVSEEDLRGFYRSSVDQIRSVTGLVLQNALGLVTGAAALLVNIVFCLIISVYLMLDGRRIVAGSLALVPRNYRGEVQAVLQTINDNFDGYIRGQLILALVYAVAVALVMWVSRLEFIVICAIFAGIAMIIPFVGPFVSLVPTLLVAILSKPGDTWWILILLIIAQQIVLNVIAPRIFGQAVNMHPLLVIGAAMTGATVAGVWGALFGIPVAGILASIVKRLYLLQQQREASQTEAEAEQSSVASRQSPAGSGPPLAGSGPPPPVSPRPDMARAED